MKFYLNFYATFIFIIHFLLFTTHAVGNDYNSDKKVGIDDAITALKIVSGIDANISLSSNMKWVGAWTVKQEQYNINDIVSYDGSAYICTLGHQPIVERSPTNTGVWTIFVSKGNDGIPPEHQWNDTFLRFRNSDGSWGNNVDLKGEKGDQGDKGEKGDQGLSPDHQWSDTSLRFKGSNGVWGTYVNLKGEQGDHGLSPEYQWSDTSLRFKNSNGVWGSYVNLKGDKGEQGEQGLPPEHEWSGSSLRFKNSNGSWGSLKNLKGDKGDTGASPFSLNGNNAYYTVGNVGIGTTTPERKLDINGHLRVRDNIILSNHTAVTFENSDGQLNYLGMRGNNNDDLEFFTNGQGRIIVDKDSGNVGIGSMNPAQKLTVMGTIESTSGGFKFPDGTTQSTAATGFSLNGNNAYYTVGNVGIGTTTPERKLDINGILRVRDNIILSNHCAVTFENSDGQLSYLGMRGNNNDDLEFFTNGLERITVDKDSGNVGIGLMNPSRKLSVNGDAGGTSAWNNDSDARLKKNVETIKNALAMINALRGVQFEWIETKNHPKGKQIGFIGQESEKVIPEVVQVKNGYYSMQYAPITAVLVEAVKEMKSEKDKEIENLKKENESLKQILSDLIKRVEVLEK